MKEDLIIIERALYNLPALLGMQTVLIKFIVKSLTLRTFISASLCQKYFQFPCIFAKLLTLIVKDTMNRFRTFLVIRIVLQMNPYTENFILIPPAIFAGLSNNQPNIQTFTIYY